MIEATLTPKQIVEAPRGEIIGAYIQKDRLCVYLKDMGEYSFDLDEFDCEIKELWMSGFHLMTTDNISLNRQIYNLLKEVGMRR
jgi:hypothetical protein